MKLRKLKLEDVQLALGMNETFREGFITPEGAAAFLSEEKNWLFAAVDAGRIIAFAYGYEMQRLDDGRMLYIHEVAVAEDKQRRGVGTQLMEALKAACREAGIRKMFLITDQANQGANALYTKVGGELGVDSGGDDRMYWFRT